VSFMQFFGSFAEMRRKTLTSWQTSSRHI